MDHRDIEDILKGYRRKESVINTTLARIEGYEFALKNPHLHDGLMCGNPIEPGMPRAKNITTSPVERAVFGREESCRMLKEWIKEDGSRIYPYQRELEQINLALNALTEQARYIIELKYFEGIPFWSDIEEKFNSKFKTRNYLTFESLKKINRESLAILKDILEDYYNRHTAIYKSN